MIEVVHSEIDTVDYDTLCDVFIEILNDIGGLDNED